MKKYLSPFLLLGIIFTFASFTVISFEHKNPQTAFSIEKQKLSVPCLIYISPQTHRLPAPNKTMVNYHWTSNNNSCYYAVTKQYSINGGAWQSSTASPVSPVIFNGVPCTTNNTRVRVIGHIIHLGQPSNQTATSGTYTLPPCF